MNSIRSHSRPAFAIPLLATLSLAGAMLILPSATLAASDVSDASSPHKVFVCKYVGTPGVNERLKAGQNPISVDIHSIDEYKTFEGDIDTLVGAHFADAQGRSFVLAVDRGQPVPPVSDCPSPSSGETPTASPSASPSETPTASPSETASASPTASPSETASASPSETPNASQSASPSASPVATPTSNLVVVPTSAPSGAVDAVVGAPQLTPPATDTTSALPAGQEGNPAPVLLLLAALTGVIALATPRARTKARRTR